MAVAILGASGGAAFATLCLAMTALMAVPLLGELPSLLDWMATTLILAGVYVVSGGPLPGRKEYVSGCLWRARKESNPL